MFYSVAPPRPYLSWGFLRWLHLSSVEYFRSFQPVSGLRNWYLAVGQASGLSKLFSLIHFISFYISKASHVFSYSRLPVKSIAIKCMKSISFFFVKIRVDTSNHQSDLNLKCKLCHAVPVPHQDVMVFSTPSGTCKLLFWPFTCTRNGEHVRAEKDHWGSISISVFPVSWPLCLFGAQGRGRFV